ncbi:MAG: alpha/beta fold hydrolase [Bryobacteraceae bacterium]
MASKVHRLYSITSSVPAKKLIQDYSETMRVRPIETDLVRGYIHEPEAPTGAGIVLTHGAGANCGSKLLTTVAATFASAGFVALRCDLAFRKQRPSGPPSPHTAARDRQSLRDALRELGQLAPGPRFLGGHSYGGRQASMLAAEDPKVAAGLLLLSYPLHPPKKPEQARTAQFPDWKTPAVFVHGTKDPFGTIAELEQAVAIIPAHTYLIAVERAGHDLGGGRFDLQSVISELLKLGG